MKIPENPNTLIPFSLGFTPGAGTGKKAQKGTRGKIYREGRGNETEVSWVKTGGTGWVVFLQ
jgi:hypothetical protein